MEPFQIARMGGWVWEMVQPADFWFPATGARFRRQLPARFFRAGARFTTNVGSRLVLAQSEKNRLPQKTVMRPLGKFDLRHQVRADPRYLVHFRAGHALAEAGLSGHRQIGE